jgi:hypothetical protein
VIPSPVCGCPVTLPVVARSAASRLG